MRSALRWEGEVLVRPSTNQLRTLRGLRVASLLVLSISATAGAATPTATAIQSSQGTPTPTATGAAAEALIAIDNLVARGSSSFVTNFDAFTAGTFAENLNVSGITFAPDPPGSWQIADASAEPFGAPFQTLTGEILAQSTAGTLIISFASPVNSFTCDFAMNRPRGASGILVQSYAGTTQVSSTPQLTTVGTDVGEGSINLNTATAFDKVRLSSLVSAVTPTPTPTSKSGTGSLDPTKTCCSTPNTTPNPPGITAGSGGAGCSITAPGAAASPVLLALPFLIAGICYRWFERGGAARDEF